MDKRFRTPSGRNLLSVVKRIKFIYTSKHPFRPPADPISASPFGDADIGSVSSNKPPGEFIGREFDAARNSAEGALISHSVLSSYPSGRAIHKSHSKTLIYYRYTRDWTLTEPAAATTKREGFPWILAPQSSPRLQPRRSTGHQLTPPPRLDEQKLLESFISDARFLHRIKTRENIKSREYYKEFKNLPLINEEYLIYHVSFCINKHSRSLSIINIRTYIWQNNQISQAVNHEYIISKYVGLHHRGNTYVSLHHRGNRTKICDCSETKYERILIGQFSELAINNRVVTYTRKNTIAYIRRCVLVILRKGNEIFFWWAPQDSLRSFQMTMSWHRPTGKLVVNHDGVAGQ